MENLPIDKKQTFTKGIEFGVRFYACVLFCIYGIGKAVQFGQGSNTVPDFLAGGEFTGQQIMWLFFGYSMIYPIFIGTFQVIGGLLLLFERTKLLGVLLLLPVVSNIILLDLVYEVNVGALFYAISLLIALLFIIYWERKKIAEIILVIIKQSKKQPFKEKTIQVIIGMVLALIAFFAVRIVSDSIFATYFINSIH